MIRYDNSLSKGRLLMMVHDELVISVPKRNAKKEIPLLTSAMEEMPGWDVPFRAEVETGLNWHDLEKWIN